MPRSPAGAAFSRVPSLSEASRQRIRPAPHTRARLLVPSRFRPPRAAPASRPALPHRRSNPAPAGQRRPLPPAPPARTPPPNRRAAPRATQTSKPLRAGNTTGCAAATNPNQPKLRKPTARNRNRNPSPQNVTPKAKPKYTNPNPTRRRAARLPGGAAPPQHRGLLVEPPGARLRAHAGPGAGGGFGSRSGRARRAEPPGGTQTPHSPPRPPPLAPPPPRIRDRPAARPVARRRRGPRSLPALNATWPPL